MMRLEFEVTSKFCYAFARDYVIPAIKARADLANGAPFRLVDAVKPIINEYVSEEQQTSMFPLEKYSAGRTVRQVIKFYAERIAKDGGALTWLGNGMYRLPTVDDVSDDEIDAIDDAAVEDSAADGDDDESAVVAAEFEGHIYAFSFPSLVRTDAPFAIKVGMTVGDVEQRVAAQCKGSGFFEKPVVLGAWPVKRVGSFETAVHSILKVRGKWREHAPGVEWFDTTVADVENIVEMVRG